MTTGYRAEARDSWQDEMLDWDVTGIVDADPDEIRGGLIEAATGRAGGSARSAIRIRAICWLKNLRW